MRVGLVIYGSLNTLSGGYLYDRLLVENLARAGHSVEIISLPWRGYAAHLTDNFSNEVRRLLTRKRVDVWLQDEMNHPSLFRLNRDLRRSGGPPLLSIVHHLRSSENHPAVWMPLYRAVERAYLHSLDGCLFNSRTTRQTVEALTGQRRPAAVATPGGDRLMGAVPLGESEIASRCDQDGPLRVLFVGNLTPRKGLHFLLDALGRIPSANWQLDVVGRMNMKPAYTRSLMKTLQASPWKDQVRFHGALDQDELKAVYRSSQVLAVPSSYEGFGIVYLEGFSFGLPAVGTTYGAAGEVIGSGDSGLLIPPGDAPGLAAGLARLANDRGHLLTLSLGARRRYLTFPGWEASMNSARLWIESMAAGGGA
mgnify:FL=1